MPTDEQTEARVALFQALTKVATESAEFSGTTQSEMLRDAAIAWRALAGGTQPGSIVIQK